MAFPGLRLPQTQSCCQSRVDAADLYVACQACLPVKDLDLGYNLVRTHDGKGAFVIVDHDELDPVTSRAPMSTVYASGAPAYASQHDLEDAYMFGRWIDWHKAKLCSGSACSSLACCLLCPYPKP